MTDQPSTPPRLTPAREQEIRRISPDVLMIWEVVDELDAVRDERDELRRQLRNSVDLDIALTAERDALRAERDRARKSRDEYKALASVGTWHEDCRPNRHKAAEEIQKSQQRIDQLAGQLAEVRAELAALRAELRGVTDRVGR